MLQWSNYLLISLFPVSIYWSMRRFGFDRIIFAKGALVSSLGTTNGFYGFDFRSYIFAGWGLYAQLWAMVLLPLALAMSYRTLREGRGYLWAVLLLSATLMSHLLYGYMAFITLGILALVHPDQLSNPRSLAVAVWTNWRRLAILLLLVIAVASYFLVPFFLDRPYLNNSVFHHITGHDSYGHSAVLRGLVVGHLYLISAGYQR